MCYGKDDNVHVVCHYPFSVAAMLGEQKRSKTSFRIAAISQGSRRSISLRCNIYTGFPSRKSAMEGDDGG